MPPVPFQLDFVGVGAARSGTSWLARCLGQHPEIFIPARKELHYFDNDTVFEPTLTRLRAEFADAPAGCRLGEFTPRYLISRSALARIRAAFPDAGILVCLRDPVERAFSQYRYFRVNLGKEPEPDFTTAFDGYYREDYLQKSLYAEALRGLFATWGRERVQVVIYDDIRVRPNDLLRETFRFLGVDDGFVPDSAGETVNATRAALAPPPRSIARLTRWLTYSDLWVARGIRRAMGRRVPRLDAGVARPAGGDEVRRLDPAVRSALFRRHFARDVEETERLLGRDLSPWRA